jgi:outer membrane receptor protein involved in Fe transport
MIAKRTGFRAWRWTALPSLLLMSMSLHAQTTPKSVPCTAQEIAAKLPQCEELQEIVVTGSRIARPDLDRLVPTTTIDSKTLDARGYLDIGQALNQLPQFAVSPSSAANAQTGFGIAQSFVDMYGLGSQRTLTLVNGRRFVSANTASSGNSASNSPVGGPGSQVDLNTVPTKLIDHVEAISVGGAPVYGADAIAGAVNIILKKDYQGIDVDAQVGASQVPDAWNYRARALAGQNLFDDRMNVMLVAEFTKADGLRGDSRKVIADGYLFEPPVVPPAKGQCCTYVLTPDGTVPSLSTGGIPMLDDIFIAPAFGFTPAAFGVTNAAGQTLAFAPGGTLQPYNLGNPTGNGIFNSGGDGFRFSSAFNLLSPLERVNIDTLNHFQVNEHLDIFGEGWFSESHASNLATQPAYNSLLFAPAGTAGGSFVININNPFLSPTDRQTIQTALNKYAAAFPFGVPLYQGVAVGPGQPVAYAPWNTSQFYLPRANVDLQGGAATGTQILARGVLGARGDFGIGERNYHWETSMSYGTVDSTQVTPAYVFQNLANALNATTNAAGQIVCAGNPVNANISTISSTCAPLNVFGTGSPSTAALAYITHMATAESFNTQRDLNAFISGDIWKLPAGDWKGSVGFENRRESADFTPDVFYSGTYGQGTATAIEGSYITNELYAETLVPIFGPAQDIPVLHRLEFEGAARRVDNSLAGNATTYTYGLRWAPVEDVLFRGNKTKSIRAPSITELFLPSSTSYQGAQDPCDVTYSSQGPDPATRQKNCAAAGIPKNFVSFASSGTVTGTSSGNPNLMSETAFSKTFGVVLSPRWVPKLHISADYIDIELRGAISSLSLGNNLDACYDSTAYPNEPSCQAFTRDPVTHQITNFHAGYINAGLLEFTGIQAAIDYTFELPRNWGAVQTGLRYLDSQRLRSIVGSAAPNDLAGEIGYSKNKGNIDLLYKNQGFFWDWQAIFIGPAVFNTSYSETEINYFGVGSWWLINSTIGMEFTPHFGAQLIVNNVFDKEPPFPALAGGGVGFTNSTSTYFSGILGRAFQLGAHYKFR